jgi:hypothetical protein
MQAIQSWDLFCRYVRFDREKEGTMPTDLQSRSQYLVLAEFCQRIIGSLSDYRDGTVELPRDILQDAVNALQFVKQGDPYRFGQKPAAALGSYEQVRTLEQVFRKPEQLNEALQLTAGLLADAPEQNEAKVTEVIRLFTKLQTKALWNFEQPTPTAPPDISELCKAFGTA